MADPFGISDEDIDSIAGSGGNWYDPLVDLGSSAWDWLLDGDNAEGIGGLLSAGGTALGLFQNDQARAGYQGKIPKYTAVREQLPNSNPDRRPGGGGQRYFTDTYYGQTPEAQQAVGSLADAQAAADAQKMALVAQNPEQFAKGGVVDVLNSMYGRGTGGGSGYGNSNGGGKQLSGLAGDRGRPPKPNPYANVDNWDANAWQNMVSGYGNSNGGGKQLGGLAVDIGSPPRRNPYGNVDNWDANAWQNMVNQVQATEPQMSGPIMTQGGPANDPRFQPGGAWYQQRPPQVPQLMPSPGFMDSPRMSNGYYMDNDSGFETETSYPMPETPADNYGDQSMEPTMEPQMSGPIMTHGGPADDPRFQPGGAWYQPPKPKFDTNSAAFKEALTKKMYEDAIAKSGISVEELYKAAGIPNPHAPAPDVFTGGSQYFDESTGQYTGGPNAPKSMPPRGMAQGGIVNAMPRAYLNGSSDGMGDQVPAMIDNQRPASLSHGEMVIPADVVSHMGNGNSDAGAKQFYDMMDRVRKARTGNKQQGKQINPNKFIPR
mgnify:CR=1 FL=1